MTINLPEILRDLEIKRAALLPDGEKPRFDGGAAVHGTEVLRIERRIQMLRIAILVLKIRKFRICQQKTSVAGGSVTGVYIPSRSDCVIT